MFLYNMKIFNARIEQPVAIKVLFDVLKNTFTESTIEINSSEKNGGIKFVAYDSSLTSLVYWKLYADQLDDFFCREEKLYSSFNNFLKIDVENKGLNSMHIFCFGLC